MIGSLRKARWAIAILALSLVLVACSNNNTSTTGATGGSQGLSGELTGAGASSQQAAMQAWVAGFNAENPDVTINYDPVGSGGGREQFTAGAVDFAGSDAYLDDDELAAAQEVCGGGDNVIELPTYISPIAVIFNLEGVDSLNMTPDLIARIFNEEITVWSDPAIAEVNPDADLPDLAITPVHRSDESGTTENFVDYLAQAAPDAWPHEVGGDWPLSSGEAAQGTSGVVNAVGSGDGTIGYADASQVGDLGVVSVEVGGQFVEYSPEAAAAIVDAATTVEGRGTYDFAVDLDRTPDGDAYPIVLLSYELACTQYDDQTKADLVKSFLSYVISEAGQQIAAENAGSAPISDSVRSQAQGAVDAISSGG